MPTVLGLAWTLWGYINTHLVNQGLHKLGHWSSNVSNQCIHIINHLQQHLLPDHTATPTIFTKHRDHPHLLDTLSAQTNRQLSLSTTQTFNSQQKLHQRDTITTQFYTHIPSCLISSIKPEIWTYPLVSVICPVLYQLQYTTYKCLRDQHT